MGKRAVQEAVGDQLPQMERTVRARRPQGEDADDLGPGDEFEYVDENIQQDEGKSDRRHERQFQGTSFKWQVAGPEGVCVLSQARIALWLVT